MKQAFRNNIFGNKYPKYVSPQIATFPDRFPYESNNTNIEHWHGIHLAFVDYPAYGFQKTDMKGKCYGSEQMCQVQLKSAAVTTGKAFTTQKAVEIHDLIMDRRIVG